MKNLFFYLIVSILFIVSCQQEKEEVVSLNEFKNPEQLYGPYTWWHWINGNVSREGIKKDLEAMASKGIAGVTVFSLGGDYPQGSVKFNSNEWHALISYAIQEANRLGIKLTFHNCDGWATSGGPWIKPKNAMKKISYSKTTVFGPNKKILKLNIPASYDNFFKDIAVFAIKENKPTYKMHAPEYNCQLKTNFDIQNTAIITDNDASTSINISLPDIYNRYIDFVFNSPFSANGLFISSEPRYFPKKMLLQYALTNDKFITIDTIYNDKEQFLQRFNLTLAKKFRLVFLEYNNPVTYLFNFRIGEVALLQKDESPNAEPITGWQEKSGLWHYYQDARILQENNIENNKFSISNHSIINITNFYNADSNQLSWNVPAGKWTILRMGYTLTGAMNAPATPEGAGLECDKLNLKGLNNSLEGYVQKLIDQNKKYIGKGFDNLLIDSYEADVQNWTDDLPEKFENYRGYSLIDYLPVLAGYSINNIEESERFLYDFRKTLSDLYMDNFLLPMKEYCAENGLKFNSEAGNSWGGFLVDAIRYQSVPDIPMNEFWVGPESGTKIFGADGGFKDAVSAARIYDKKVIACESFTSSQGNWQHSPKSLKYAVDKAFASGINRLTFHTFVHQPDERVPGWQMNPWGIAYNRKLTWWEYSKGWITYLTRCQYMLQKGQAVADALVFTGEDVPSSLLKSYQISPLNLFPKGYDYDGCDLFTLLNNASVVNNKIVLKNGLSYAVLVMPEVDYMSIQLVQKIKELVSDGAIVYARKPIKTYGLKNHQGNDKLLQEITKDLWGACNGIRVFENTFGKGKIVYGIPRAHLFKYLNILPDIQVSDTTITKLNYIHKKTGSTDYYFISNESNTAGNVEISCRVTGKKPFFWDPVTGNAYPLSYKIMDSYTKINMSLQGGQAGFIVFQEPTHQTNYALKPVMIKQIKVESDLNSDWTVLFQGLSQKSTMKLDRLEMLNLNNNNLIKYFSGTAIYTKTIYITKNQLSKISQYYIDLGEVFDIATISINNSKEQVLWHYPFKLNVTGFLQEGENQVTIKVANSWANRLIGDLLLSEQDRATWTNNTTMYTLQSKLINSGLKGPVRLLEYTRY